MVKRKTMRFGRVSTSPYCIGFCAASPLPGRVRLEALSMHNFRDGLKVTGRIGLSEIRKRWGFDRLEVPMSGLLSGFVSVFEPSNQVRCIKKGEFGSGQAPFEGFCRIIWEKWISYLSWLL